MLLDSIIYLRNPLNWDKQVHQVLGTSVAIDAEGHPSCPSTLLFPKRLDAA